MRAVANLIAVALVALSGSAHADNLFSFGAGYQLSSGNEPGVLDMQPVAYPFERSAIAVQFDGELDDITVTDRGGYIGMRLHGKAHINTSYTRATEMGKMEPSDAETYGFMIGGGTLLRILRGGAWRLDGHFSLEWFFTDQLAIASGIRARRIRGRSVQRLQYDVRPFWLGTNRLEHELTVGLGLGGIGVRASAILGDERDRAGGYRYQTFTFGVEIVR